MKKNNIFLTFTFICLAIMVAFASSCGVIAAAPVGVQAANSQGTTKLFNETTGEYAVARSAITKGEIFNFFGYDWVVVNVNNETEVATFWMVNPFAKSVFNQAPGNPNANQSKDNTWSNGYTSAAWNTEQFDESTIRAFLRAQAATMMDHSAYKDKVVAGYVPGSNTVNAECSVKENAYYNAQGSSADGTHYACTEDKDAKSFTANFGLTQEDYLWLPSLDEVQNGGVWDLNNSYRNYNATANGELAWLRSPAPIPNEDEYIYNFKAFAVGYRNTIAVPGATTLDGIGEQSIFVMDVDQAAAVRPAIHLSLASTPTAGGSSGNNGDKSGWFTDDMMKVFFIIICVLGVVGVILVIIAVVRKSRERKQTQN